MRKPDIYVPLDLQFDAVLPLVKSDWQRVDRLLLPTLEHYATGLQKIWVIVPPKDYVEGEHHFANSKIIVLAETDLVPELRELKPDSPKGWYIQQLLKLAAARLVSTDWYLTLDGDCLIGRHLRKSDLIREGKLVARADRISGHNYWYEWAERVLGLPWSGQFFGVTPAPLHRQSVLDLFDYISQRHGNDAERVLLESFPWTEYALYYTFMEATGRLEQVHLTMEKAIYGNCIWRANLTPPSKWYPGQTFGDSVLPFTVLQSTHVDMETLDELVKRIRDWFAANGRVSPI